MKRNSETSLASVWLLASMHLMAAGCQFRPNPSFMPHTEDLAPPPEPAPAAGLAPSDDLARPAAFDLGTPGASPTEDLLSPCSRVSEPFAADPSASWTLQGDAVFDPSHGLQLTALGCNVAGSAFYSQALPGAAFDATFTFRMGDGSGADGLAFVVASAASPTALAPFGNGMLNAGFGLGYLGMDGFAIELDTFMNLNNGDPNGNHVSLVRTSDGKHLLTGTPTSASLRSNAPRLAHIRFTGAHLTVEIDGAKMIDAELPSAFSMPTGTLYFGFTAASSAINDRHGVSDLTLLLGPPGACF